MKLHINGILIGLIVWGLVLAFADEARGDYKEDKEECGDAGNRMLFMARLRETMTKVEAYDHVLITSVVKGYENDITLIYLYNVYIAYGKPDKSHEQLRKETVDTCMKLRGHKEA